MPLLTRPYPGVRFPADVLRAGRGIVGGSSILGAPAYSFIGTLVLPDGQIWSFEKEDEFFAEYGRDELSVRAEWRFGNGRKLELISRLDDRVTELTIALPDKPKVLQAFEQFDREVPRSQMPPRNPRIVIGHGGSTLWRQLKDHLHDHHGFEVRSFETRPQAGRTIQEVLDELLENNDMGLLVHTAEDEQPDGGLRARQNVVHETGLFQARYGWGRAVIIREDGCESFSNVSGIVEIRFSPGNIREVFGEVVATIRRELLS